MVTKDRLGLSVKELLDIPTSYNHRKVIVKVVKTLQALLRSKDLLTGFCIAENFVEVYKDAGKRELEPTFGICAPQLAYFDGKGGSSAHLGAVQCATWSRNDWLHETRAATINDILENTMVQSLLMVSGLSIF